MNSKAASHAAYQQPDVYSFDCLLFIFTCGFILYSVLPASYKVRKKEYDNTFIGSGKRMWYRMKKITKILVVMYN